MDTEKMKALALAATQGEWQKIDRTVYVLEPDGWRKGVEQFRNRFSCTMSHDGSGIPRSELLANAEFIAASNPAAVLELIAEVERLRAVMKQAATGYEGGFFASSPRDLDGKFVLHYESPQEAEAAFMALTTEIEAELPSRCRAEGGGTSDKSSELIGSAPAAGTDKDAERYRKLFEIEDFCRDPLWPVVDWMRGTVAVTKEEVDAALDSVGAHTKAGKEPE